ncbi:DUF2971 domain-containing protein [[Clostridium] fimetarium]|uniref:DUF2971 domain-containing protein n=1 Tax=[Clostridium] fimetarium TaxID=99656 RepID=A0A1I0QW12_9FIRM|nr:DUF2971 domain-containing protein [[Clostridium] fimetarium]SEW31192.1 Protein of unknown function [[Clostridium] fimetarium]
MRNQRKTPSWGWYYNEKESKFDIKDYRNWAYKGDWANHYINEMAKLAVKNNKSIYEVAWKFIKDKEEHLPPKLYKFYPLNINSLKCIESDSIYLNSPQYFNDPYDCHISANEDEFVKKYVLSHIEQTNPEKSGINKEQYIRLLSSVCFDVEKHLFRDIPITFERAMREITDGNYDSELYRIQREGTTIFEKTLLNLKDNDIKVTSFAALDDIKLSTYIEMWGHYADSHKGFCVEYDFNDYIKNSDNTLENLNNTIMSCLLPIIYKSKPREVPIDLFYKKALNNKLTAFQENHFKKFLLQNYLTKSSAWSYENEWRLILTQNECEKYNNMLPFPYIKAIYLGYGMSLENKEYMYKLAMRKGISVYDCALRDDSYELNFYEKQILFLL